MKRKKPMRRKTMRRRRKIICHVKRRPSLKRMDGHERTLTVKKMRSELLRHHVMNHCLM
jgi:hypothetical protein